ncbi:hypothetical protein [Runella sp.]|uniref:hypothetical protein n=1 Tax=Runella sp. TaxID=1960881 RepID=UPI0026369997|nr:hypothetical protein [Runella sp.]
MNPKTEQVIALKNDGWSLRNIANEVGISVFTVRSILAKQAQPTPDIVDTAVDAYPDESVPKAEVKNLLSGLLAEHSNNQLRAAKKKYVDQFNRLIDEWLDNSDGCTWNGHDLNMFNDSITRLKKDLFEFCEGLGISTEDLAIFQNAAEIKLVFMEFLKIEDDVTFDFDDELYGIIDSLKVEDFDDPHTGVDLLKEIEIA